MKRAIDLTLSIIIIIVLSPVILLVALTVAVGVDRRVIFVQARGGHGGVPFRLYKFRTMRDLRDEDGEHLPDAERLTALGRFLRSTSLDELPSLVNVIRGDMSLVGPRPLIADYLSRYSPDQARRHEVRPGITGCVQVMGRNSLSWDEKFALDVWYVDNRTLWLDLRILAMTVGNVLARRGISEEGHATMSIFSGSGEVDEEGNSLPARQPTTSHSKVLGQ
jgi:lipopolysaccharide/colanic/teichoic acid biosynthesis glycosyltransferase